MKSTQVVYIYLAIIGLVGFNVFLAQRDQQLYDSFDKLQRQGVSNTLTPHEKVCSSLKVWHPDCKIE
jgi:hypothetical protein